MEKKVIQLDDDVYDDFLSILDEAEAEALSAARSKRQKASAAAGDSQQEATEGPYMAALRGSRSTLWQQQQQKQQHPRKQEHRPWQKKDDIINLSTADKLSASDTGACFKCGVSGHWARDCTAGGGRQGEGGGGLGAEGDVPEKACPCGSGSCLVLTSNTAKNPGRKFYRCPLRPENGGCNFFEWCDGPSSGTSAPISASNYQSNPSVPDLPCPCGAGSCLVLVTKTGKNVGQQYYRCPANEGRGSCGFFKWCIERNSTANQPTFTSQFTSQYNPSSQYSGERNVSSCFKCGQEGHWARDCTKPSSDHSADGGMNRSASSGSGTCFKCGKSGHWARDCPTQDSRADSGSRKASDTFSSRFR